MIRSLTKISVDTDFGNSAVDKVRAETVDDLISLSQSFDWECMEIEQDSNQVVDRVVAVVALVAAV